MGITPQRIGDLLVKKGLVSVEQVNQALKEQRATNEFFGTILIRNGWLEEDALLAALAEQFGLRFVRLNQEEIDWSVASRFAYDFLMEHGCFPMQLTDESLTVALSNPLNAWALSELERKAKYRKVALVLASARDIRAAIQQAHRPANRAGGPTGGRGGEDVPDDADRPASTPPGSFPTESSHGL